MYSDNSAQKEVEAEFRVGDGMAAAESQPPPLSLIQE